MPGPRERLVAAALALSLHGSAVAAVGFLNDGTGRWGGASPTAAALAQRVAWRAPISGWSNASPVPVGDRVCVTAEPVELLCFDAATGAQRWRAQGDVLGALPADLAATLRDGIGAAEAAQQALPGLVAEQGRLRREVRSGRAEAVTALEAVSAELLRVRKLLDDFRPYLTPPVMEQIGWSTPTPLAVDGDLIAVFGNGVVARFGPDGARRWAVWLGASTVSMRGYTIGTTASPRLVDGVLVVGHGELRGLDPATGATRWRAGPYADYGTPAVVRLDGRSLLATGDGRLIDARTGAVAASGLGDVYFVSPVAVGSSLWFIGGKTGGHLASEGAWARRVDLSAVGGAIRGEERWTVPLPSRERVFAQPLLVGGALHVLQEDGTYTRLDPETGAVLRTHTGAEVGCPVGWFSAGAATDDAVWFACESGTVARYGAADATSAVIGPTRAALAFAGDHAYVRTFEGLVALRR